LGVSGNGGKRVENSGKETAAEMLKTAARNSGEKVDRMRNA
jgi:hypothetical protein